MLQSGFNCCKSNKYPYQTVYYMQKRCIAGLLIFGLLVVKMASAQDVPNARVLHFASAHTSFPDTAREQGHLYDNVTYTTAEHYMDSSVMLIIPPGLKTNKTVDLVFWFHGWF